VGNKKKITPSSTRGGGRTTIQEEEPALMTARLKMQNGQPNDGEPNDDQECNEKTQADFGDLRDIREAVSAVKKQTKKE